MSLIYVLFIKSEIKLRLITPQLKKKKVLFQQDKKPWLKFMNCTSNWLTTHRIHQICFLVTFFCYLTRRGYRIRGSLFYGEVRQQYLEGLKKLEHRWQKFY